MSFGPLTLEPLSRPQAHATRSAPGRHWFRTLVGWSSAGVLLAFMISRTALPELWAPDYIQFWTASTILLDGGNPFDPVAQATEQARLGWDIERDGLGQYAFMPYYYPPWVAMAAGPLVLLGYSGAKATWLAALMLAVVGSGWLMRSSVPRMRPSLVVAMVVSCALWWTVVPLGQLAPLVLLIVVATWRLATARDDYLAGAMLALLSIKPQLGACIAAASLIWSVRQGRRRLLYGFLLAGVALAAASMVAAPGWVGEMLAAPRRTPLVTDENPSLGATWLCLLRTVGLSGAWLAIAYLALAAPTVFWLLRTAWRRDATLSRVLACGALATFIVAPYARYYDLPLLLISALWLLGQAMPTRAQQALTLCVVVVPVLLWFYTPTPIPAAFEQARWAWLPAVLAASWFAASRVTAPLALRPWGVTVPLSDA